MISFDSLLLAALVGLVLWFRPSWLTVQIRVAIAVTAVLLSMIFLPGNVARVWYVVPVFIVLLLRWPSKNQERVL